MLDLYFGRTTGEDRKSQFLHREYTAVHSSMPKQKESSPAILPDKSIQSAAGLETRVKDLEAAEQGPRYASFKSNRPSITKRRVIDQVEGHRPSGGLSTDRVEDDVDVDHAGL